MRCSNRECDEMASAAEYYFTDNFGRGLEIFRYCSKCQLELVDLSFRMVRISGTKHVLPSRFVRV